MTKTLYTTFLLICVFMTTETLAQKNALEAHYTKTLKITDEINGIEDVNTRQLIIDKYKNSTEYYALYFNKLKYIFTKAPIDKEVELIGDASLYTDMANQKNIAIKSILGKDFIVEKNMPQAIEWNIESERTKQILNLQCIKATTIDVNGNNVVAWFATEIPFPTGPYGYGGLPGLILRLETKNETYEVTSISSAPEDVLVKEPNVKHVTPQEFSEMKNKKLKELGADPNQNGGVQVIRL